MAIHRSDLVLILQCIGVDIAVLHCQCIGVAPGSVALVFILHCCIVSSVFCVALAVYWCCYCSVALSLYLVFQCQCIGVDIAVYWCWTGSVALVLILQCIWCCTGSVALVLLLQCCIVSVFGVSMSVYWC